MLDTTPVTTAITRLISRLHTHLRTPGREALRMDALQHLWRAAGLDALEAREITVERTFTDFEDCWATSLLGTSVGPTVAVMPSGDTDLLKTRVREWLPADATGRITYSARANAVKRADVVHMVRTDGAADSSATSDSQRNSGWARPTCCRRSCPTHIPSPRLAADHDAGSTGTEPHPAGTFRVYAGAEPR